MANELIGCRTCSSPYCKGCNMFTLYKALNAGKFDALMSANRTLYDSDLDNLDRDRWISVEERLPEKEEYVLIRFRNNDMSVACVFDRWSGYTFWRAQTDEGWCADCDTEPTHWMPLPEPPKEET